MNRQVVYRAAPPFGAIPEPSTTFAVEETEDVDDIDPGELLVQNRYLSVDAYHRFALYNDAEVTSQFPAARVGSVLGTYGVGRVLQSRDPSFAVGTTVYGWLRWEQQTVVTAENVQHLAIADVSLDPLWYLGPLGAPGLAAYAGLTEIGLPEPRETIVIPATTGAVGSVVAALAKRRGLRIVGSASSLEKAHALIASGIDAVVDHRDLDGLGAELEAACPQGIDIYFELVGGAFLDRVLPLLNVGARIPFAGLLTQYNLAPDAQYGVRNLGRILAMNVTIRSYDNHDYRHLRPALSAEIVPMLGSGQLAFTPHITRGLESMPQALADIFTGEARGSRIIDLEGD